MNYQKAMNFLSELGIGAMVLVGNKIILEINDAGDKMLHGEGLLKGTQLPKSMWGLCDPVKQANYVNVAFNEYLIRDKAPSVNGLPPSTDFIIFKDASIQVGHDMMKSVLNQMPTCVVITDSSNRMYFVNDADVTMESMPNGDILGDSIYTVYNMLDGSDLLMPKAIKTRQPILNHRQYYSTRPGRKVDAVANCYPIVKNGQVLGAVNLLEDYTKIDSLQKQVLDLQQKLVNISSGEKNDTKSPLAAKYNFKDIIHTNENMTRIIDRCERIASSDSHVMLYGETGTGKELFAQSIHNASRRSNYPFLAINCAAIPENLLESILFGTEKGAYTGAESRAGLFEQANHGTLLLDEINSMHINIQAKLLRAIQEHSIRRLGGVNEIPVDVRIISNINIPPNQAINENKLRQDLFFRLGVVLIEIPPLRERKSDIELLSKNFIMHINSTLHTNVRELHPDVLRLFQQYSWPGNVRELQHIIEYTMNILPPEQDSITLEYIPETFKRDVATPNLDEALNEFSSADNLQPAPMAFPTKESTYRIICDALIKCNGNITHAAKMLNISRQNMQYHIKKKNIDIKELLSKK